jgi:hypothetical protein
VACPAGCRWSHLASGYVTFCLFYRSLPLSLDWFPERFCATESLRKPLVRTSSLHNPCPLSHTSQSSVFNPLVHTITYSTPHAQHLQILSRYSTNHSRTFISLTLFYLYALWSIYLPFLLLYWRGQRLFVDLQKLRSISGSRFAWVSTALPRSPAGWNLEISRKITRHFLFPVRPTLIQCPLPFSPCFGALRPFQSQ